MVRRRVLRCSQLITAHLRHTRSLHSTLSPRTSVADLLDCPESVSEDKVIVNGYVRSIRNQKTRSFASIGDGSSLEPLQALLTPQQAQSLSTGTAIRLTGSLKPSPNHEAQSHDLHVEEVDVLGSADSTYPLQKKFHTPEYLRTFPHLRSRTPFNSTLLRFRSECMAQLTQYFHRQKFTQTHPPTITSSDCEGAGEVFSIETAKEPVPGHEQRETFFKTPKYLTVSSQLHLEALAQSVGNVWTLSPTFRAEKSDTARHLSEFYMLEAEVPFVEDMGHILDLVAGLLHHLTTSVIETRVGQELLHGKRSGDKEGDREKRSVELEERWQGMMKHRDWETISYSEAISLLESAPRQFEHTPKWGSGLQAEHERYIASHVGEGAPVFVTNYPKDLKPFYMLPSNFPDKEGETVECFDLLVPEICEIAGGSMREHRLEPLLERMQAKGMSVPGSDGPESLKWYIDLRRWGSVPHGGFGLGFDRLLCYLSGVQNIREMVAFPRWHGRCDC